MSAGVRSDRTKEKESCHHLNNSALASIRLSAQAVFLDMVGVSRTVNGEITVV